MIEHMDKAGLRAMMTMIANAGQVDVEAVLAGRVTEAQARRMHEVAVQIVGEALSKGVRPERAKKKVRLPDRVRSADHVCWHVYGSYKRGLTFAEMAKKHSMSIADVLEHLRLAMRSSHRGVQRETDSGARGAEA